MADHDNTPKTAIDEWVRRGSDAYQAEHRLDLARYLVDSLESGLIDVRKLRRDEADQTPKIIERLLGEINSWRENDRLYEIDAETGICGGDGGGLGLNDLD